jgi:L-ascorbate metabolism protein UlaG (beta-lactamase superfamily)
VEVGVRFVGHATVLVEADGVRLLTDPFLGNHLGPLRRHGPTPDPMALGEIDLVLVSHAHPDHFDLPSLRALAGDFTVIVPSGLARAARRCGHRVREIRAGQTIEEHGRHVTAVHARHWRWPLEARARTLGYLVDGAVRVYFAGDTAPFAGLARLAGRVDLALLPVGSWGPHLGPGHLDPEGAAGIAGLIGPEIAIPIHWGTFYPPLLHRLHRGPLDDPGRQFRDHAALLAPAVEVRVLRPGDGARLFMQGAHPRSPTDEG